jgi:hypothetical protein
MDLNKAPAQGADPQAYAQFLLRYLANPGSISQDEASGQYEALLRNAPPELVAEAHEYAFRQLCPEARQQLASQFQTANNDQSSTFNGFTYATLDEGATPAHLGVMASRASQQDPGLIGQLLGPDSPLSSSLGKMVLAGVAAYLASRFLSGGSAGAAPGQHQKEVPAAGGMGGLGGLLGGLLDGAGGTALGGQRGAGGADLGSLLGGLMAGQGGQGGAGGADLGSLLGGLMAGQGGQGGASGAALGSLLGGLMAGQNLTAPEQEEQGGEEPGLHVRGNPDKG